AAVRAKWMNVSVRTTSRRGRYASGSNPLTSAAICDGSPAGSKFVIRPTALTPCVICFQKASTPIPAGATTPRPLTTTRLIYELRESGVSLPLTSIDRLRPPELEDTVACQEALDERRVEDAVARQLDPRGGDPRTSQL